MVLPTKKPNLTFMLLYPVLHQGLKKVWIMIPNMPEWFRPICIHTMINLWKSFVGFDGLTYSAMKYD